MPVVIDPTAKELFERAIDDAVRNFNAWRAGHPELTNVEPPAIGGWSQLLAGIALIQGSLYERPGEAGIRAILEIMDAVKADLQRPSITVAEYRADLQKLQTGNLLLTKGAENVTEADLQTIVPSPSTVQQTTGPALSTQVARMAVWARAHHGKVHVPLARAEAQESAALHPFAAAVADLGTSTAQGFRAVVNHLLPEVRQELLQLVREERQLRRDADSELREDLVARTRALAQRVGDVVRWLRTEALPDLAEQVKAERAARKDADHDLRVGLATTTKTLEGELTDLATQVAPLAAWAGSFGVHTTTKVKTYEGAIDRLGNMDLGQLLALTAFPGLAALVVKILLDVGGKVPGVIAGLEESAVKALGAID